MSAHQPGAEPGRRVGKYRLLMPLGSGGMATVHLALSVGPRNVTQLVVIKVPRADFALDPEYHARFFDEARVAARLHHPHVVQTSDVFEHEGVPHIVMEHLEGQPLRRLTRWAFEHAPERSLPHRLRALTDALSGLHCAHELRDYDGKPLDVVHRDVSPDNVFVTYEGRVKVVDFGIAKAAGARHRTHVGSINGRIAYMAPEQLAGDQVDRRADVFSAGAMLWEEITGRSLWGDLPLAEIARRLLLHEVPRPREERAIARTPLVRICERALAPLPDDRYESADHMRRDLESVLRAWRQPVPYDELGALVSKAFERERAERRHRIDSLLARVDHTLRPPAPAPALAPPAALAGQGPRISFVPDDGDNEDLTRVVFTPPHAVPISSLHDDGEGMTRIVHTPPYAVPLASLHGENFDDNDDDDDRTRVVHTPLDTVALTSLHDDDDEEPTRFTMNPLHADAFEHDEASPRQASSVTINEFGSGPPREPPPTPAPPRPFASHAKPGPTGSTVPNQPIPFDAENVPTRPHMPAPEIVLSRKPAAPAEPPPGRSVTPGSTPSPNRLPAPSSSRSGAPSSSRSGAPSSSPSSSRPYPPSSSRSNAPASEPGSAAQRGPGHEVPSTKAPSSSPDSRPPRRPAPDTEFVPTRSLPVPKIGPPSRPSALASSIPPRASATTSSAPPAALCNDLGRAPAVAHECA